MDEIVSLPQLDPWSDTVTVNSSLRFEDERYREERLVTEEEEEEELETTTVISSDVSDKATRVMKVNYATDLPEYPETSENGVAYIINTSSMTEEAVEVMCNNVQYCHKRLQPPKPTHCSVLNNAYWTLLKNPALQSFYEHWNGKSLSDVHKSLINLDKISFILRKQQLLNYPYGQHLIGVQHEWDVSHKNKPNSYIKDLILNEENFMAVCFYTEAAKVLLNRDSFEIDMTFKRIKASEINEVVFAAFLPELNKVMTFVRVFVNQESTEMYTQLFHTVFNAIAKETGQRIQWKHLHQSGFGGIVMDMDSKQMCGLGRYLSDIDDHHRPWQWHVQHVIIYCTIHFKRGILKAVGTALSRSFLREQMEQLLYVSTQEEYFELCNLIINDATTTEQIRFWVIHKKQPCIASGLNAACSLMDKELFIQTRRHTNAVEQTHWKSTSLGKQLSILKAIQMGQILDDTDLKQYLVKVTHRINHSWRSNSLSSRYALQESRHRRKRRHRENEHNDSISVISSASSSGSRSSSRSQSRSQRRSTQPTLRRVASITSASQVQELSIERSRLELQAEAARVRRMELENEKLELELITLREAARGRADHMDHL
ncbi:hypothetical protein VF21_05187 [Pseudogymnoascus sp. 05NY08]|nr:hypothetical protein VF21_05187 [Pseudogymnoascus sp. 05NY08]